MTTSNQGIVGPTDSSDEVALADWLEATMLAEKAAYLSRAKIRKYLKSLFLEEEHDIAIEIALDEVARRSRICGDAYPFSQAQSGIRFEPTLKATAYLFMLCISVSKSYRIEKRQKETDRLFDSLVVDALKRYLGSGSMALRFGAPASDSRPSNLRDAIAWLARTLKLPLGAGRARSTGGDSGLDVVAWRPFGDTRTGYLLILAQCTVQIDWFDKAKDLAEDSWRGWIDLGKAPHLALAIPFVVGRRYEKWDELRRLVHTALDRLRLCELLGTTTLGDQAAAAAWTAKEAVQLQTE
jgi:hypothetical protein